MSKNWIGAFVAAAVLFSPSYGLATRPDCMNIIYFDANNNVIGQNVMYCNNVRWKGGSQTGHYSLLAIATCGANPPDTTCGVSGGVPYCSTGGGPSEEPGVYLDGNFGSRTITSVCNIVPQVCDAGVGPPLMTGYGFNSTFVEY